MIVVRLKRVRGYEQILGQHLVCRHPGIRLKRRFPLFSEAGGSVWTGHVVTEMVLEQLGRREEAVNEFRIAVEHSNSSSMTRDIWPTAWHVGKARLARRKSGLAVVEWRKRSFSPYWLAIIYTALDQRPEPLKW